MPKQSPTSRALAYYRDLGFAVVVVEKWNPHAGVRQDAFGFGDLLACKSGFGVVMVQATGGDGGHHAARVGKIKANPAARSWLEAGGRIEVVSFAKRIGEVTDKRGRTYRRKVVTPRREELTLAALDTP